MVTPHSNLLPPTITVEAQSLHIYLRISNFEIPNPTQIQSTNAPMFKTMIAEPWQMTFGHFNLEH
jgi:hypothetical protein